MIHITSRNNAIISECAKLKDKKYREKTGLFVFEGRKLFQEALINNVEFKYVFASKKSISLLEQTKVNAEIYSVSQSVYDKLSDDCSPDGIFCVAKQPKNIHTYIDNTTNFIPSNEKAKYFMTVSVRDPGNMGTILRTACALGIDMVLMSNDCVDIYNPKTIRSAMGAVFKQKTVKFVNNIEMIEHLKSCGYEVYAAALKQGAQTLGNFTLSQKHCFVAGNEGHGLDLEIIDACSKAVIIPMMPNTESLNVASASTILMWESYKA